MTCFYLKLPQDIDRKSIKGSIYLYKHHDLILLVEDSDLIFEPITAYPFNITLTFANYY